MRASRLVMVVIVSSLTACGGGGSSNSHSTTPTPPGALVSTADDYTFYLPSGWSGSFTQDLLVLANDSAPAGDAVTLVSVSTPQHGTAVVQANCIVSTPEAPAAPQACVVYQPTIGFIGTDSFSYAVQDQYGRTANAAITVTLADHYQLSGRVLAPAGSYAATQVGFADTAARGPIDASGNFSFDAPVAAVADMPRTLVADAPGHSADFAAVIGSFGEATSGSIRLDTFSTAAYAVLRAANGGNAPATSAQLLFAETQADWLDLIGRAAVAQLALEAGGAGIGLPSTLKITSDVDMVAQLRAQFGAGATAQRIEQLLGDAALLPLMSGLPPASLIVYAPDPNIWTGALLLRPNNDGFSYVSVYGAGTATVQVTNGTTSITPTGGPAAQIGPLQVTLLGTPSDEVFGSSLVSSGILGNQLWSAQIAPQLFASASPAGFQTANFSVIDTAAVGGTSHRLPMCSHPPAAAPISRSHIFNADSTGMVAETGLAFTWMQSSVLSIRYSDQTTATFLALTANDKGKARVVADVTFTDGQEILCSGSDVLIAQ